MAPISVFLATALIALGGVEAKKDKVRVSQWISTDCSGHLSGKQSHVEMGDCMAVNAQSIKFHKSGKDKDMGWVGLANDGRHTCKITTYSGIGCNDNALSQHLVPDRFEECIRDSRRGIRSIKFTCDSEPVSASSGSTITSTSTSTHYSFLPDGRATQVRETFTTTRPGKYLENWQRAEPTAVADTLEPRGGRYAAKGVWMKHPWGGQPLCYECWLTKKKNTDKFECESGGDSICNGPRPDMSTSLSIVSIPGTTVSTTMTGIAVVATPAPSREALDERSEKMLVWIMHPFRSVETCAKAKWKHAGKDDQRVTLKGPKSCKGKNGQLYPVNLSPSLSTVTVSGGTSTFTSITLIPGVVTTALSTTPTVTLSTSVTTSTATVRLVVSVSTSTVSVTPSVTTSTATVSVAVSASTSTISLPTSSSDPTASRAAAIADLWNQ